MLPNFFVVGAQKSATTSIHNYLVQHPDIYLPAKKETKFFVEDCWYAKGIGFYEEEYFSEWKGEAAIGEVDPDYMYFEDALLRIEKHIDLRATKFIFLLRNPVDRAFSHYLMTYRRGIEPLTFEEAIDQEPARIANNDYNSKANYSYIERGFYQRQIERFLERVDRSQMLFMLAEDIKADSINSLKRIYEFLGVPTGFLPANIGKEFHKASVPHSMVLLRRIREDSLEKKFIRLLVPVKSIRHKLRQAIINLNQTKQPGLTLDPKTRRRLTVLFKGENERLARFLGKDLSYWDSGQNV